MLAWEPLGRPLEQFAGPRARRPRGLEQVIQFVKLTAAPERPTERGSARERRELDLLESAAERAASRPARWEDN